MELSVKISFQLRLGAALIALSGDERNWPAIKRISGVGLEPVSVFVNECPRSWSVEV